MKIFHQIKKLIQNQKNTLKTSKWSIAMITVVFFLLASLFTLTDSNFGIQQFSNSINAEKSNYQISTRVDNNNFEQGKKCVFNFRNSLTMAFQAMNDYFPPQSYFFIKSNHNSFFGNKDVALVNFADFGVSNKTTADGLKFYTVGEVNINLMFEKSKTTEGNPIYISNILADKLLIENSFNNYEELLGVYLPAKIEGGETDTTYFVANIYYHDKGISPLLSNILGDFAITHSMLYSNTPAANLQIGALLDNTEYTNKLMIESFVHFFAKDSQFDITLENKNNAEKYSFLLNEYLSLNISSLCAQLIILIISFLSFIVIFVFAKKIKGISLLFPNNVLSIVIPYILVIGIFSLINFATNYLLFGSVAVLLISIVALFSLLYITIGHRLIKH